MIATNQFTITVVNDGQRGGEWLNITTAPSAYTTQVGDFTPAYRISLVTVEAQSGSTDVIPGDVLLYDSYAYPVGYVDSNYVYTSERTSMRGSDGATGATLSTQKEQYYYSNSSSSLSGGSWSDTQTTPIPSGKYLWTRQAMTMSDGSTVYSDAVHNSTIQGISSDVDSVKGSITNKVWQSDITSSINSYDGSTGAAIRDRVTQTETDISGITSRVTDVETTTGSLGTRMTNAESAITQNADNIDLMVTITEDGQTHETNLSLTQDMLEAVTDQFVVKSPDGTRTIISGGQMSTDAIKSNNYSAPTTGQAGTSPFSVAGSYFNLANGDIVTPAFYVDHDGVAKVGDSNSYISFDKNTGTLSAKVSSLQIAGTNAATTTDVSTAVGNMKIYYLLLSHAAVTKATDGTYTPSAVTVSAKSQSGSSAVANYSGRFKIETTTDNSTWTSQYTSSTNQSSYTYTIPSGVIAIRCSLYKAGGTTTLLDQRIISVVSDGEQGSAGNDAYTIVLSNDNHTFPSAMTGVTMSYDSGILTVIPSEDPSGRCAEPGNTECSVIAYKGMTQMAVTIGTITGQPTGMTTSISNNGTTSAKFTVTVTSSMTTESGTLTIPLTVDGKSFTKSFTYSLALKGDPGSPGSKGENGIGVNAVTELYYCSNSPTAPNKPTSHVTTSNVNTYNAWNLQCPTWTSVYRYYFTCQEILYDDGTRWWSNVVTNEGYNVANSTANNASKTATNYLYYSANKGLVVHDGSETVESDAQVDQLLKGNVRVTTAGMDIYNGATKMASYGSDVIIGEQTTVQNMIDFSGVKINENGMQYQNFGDEAFYVGIEQRVADSYEETDIVVGDPPEDTEQTQDITDYSICYKLVNIRDISAYDDYFFDSYDEYGHYIETWDSFPRSSFRVIQESDAHPGTYVICKSYIDANDNVWAQLQNSNDVHYFFLLDNQFFVENGIYYFATRFGPKTAEDVCTEHNWTQTTNLDVQTGQLHMKNGYIYSTYYCDLIKNLDTGAGEIYLYPASDTTISSSTYENSLVTIDGKTYYKIYEIPTLPDGASIVVKSVVRTTDNSKVDWYVENGELWAEDYNVTYTIAYVQSTTSPYFVFGPNSYSSAEPAGKYSFAAGDHCSAKGMNQVAFGRYNQRDSTSAFIIGNGNANARSNCFTVDWNGNVMANGVLYSNEDIYIWDMEKVFSE